MSSENSHDARISFGKMAVAAEFAKRLLDLEAEHDRLERFTVLDDLLGHLIVRALQGKQPLKVTESDGATTLSIKDVKPEEQEMIEESFSLGRQRSRGAWWLPEEVVTNVGTVHFAASLRKYSRFAHNVTLENRYKLSSEASPEIVFAHTILNPLFSALYEPFSLRGEQAGKQKKETRIARWKEAEKLLADLGFKVEEELSAMRYGSGWSQLSVGARLETKKQLSRALANQAEIATGAKYRALRMLALAERYYSKANETGVALRKNVLTREFELVVSGFFGGGWLGFLDYLGESPHPEEQVVTTLAETKLLIRWDEKADPPLRSILRGSAGLRRALRWPKSKEDRP